MTTTSEDIAKAFGYLYPDEIVLLKKIARLVPKNGVIVNIGAGAGTSALAFAEANPTAELHTVDIRPGGPLGGLEGERNAFAAAGKPHPIQHLGDSKEIGKDWNIPIDLLFIDGDHTDSALGADIDNWLPHVKEDGYVAFHDYDSKMWGGVVGVVDSKMKKYKVVAQADSVKVFQV